MIAMANRCISQRGWQIGSYREFKKRVVEKRKSSPGGPGTGLGKTGGLIPGSIG